MGSPSTADKNLDHMKHHHLTAYSVLLHCQWRSARCAEPGGLAYGLCAGELRLRPGGAGCLRGCAGAAAGRRRQGANGRPQHRRASAAVGAGAAQAMRRADHRGEE